MYLIKFDEEGKKISAVPLILAYDWGGVEKLKNEGYIEVSDEDWNYYTGNCGDGDNDTGYIRDSITGKPISAPARVITLEERVNALKAEYENNIKAIDEAICQVVNDVKTKNIVYMKMQSIIILCIFIIIHLLFSILSCSF